MARFALVLFALSGCLSAEPGLEESDAQDEGDGAAGGDGQAVDGPDGGAGGDAGVSADAGEDWFGPYVVTWTKTGGDCPAADNAMDRAQVGVNYLRYESVACPAVGYEQQGATWGGGELASFGGGYALENCARDEYEHLPDHSLVFDGDGFTGEISATRKRTSDNVVLCSIDLLIEGMRE